MNDSGPGCITGHSESPLFHISHFVKKTLVRYIKITTRQSQDNGQNHDNGLWSQNCQGTDCKKWKYPTRKMTEDRGGAI